MQSVVGFGGGAEGLWPHGRGVYAGFLPPPGRRRARQVGGWGGADRENVPAALIPPSYPFVHPPTHSNQQGKNERLAPQLDGVQCPTRREVRPHLRHLWHGTLRRWVGGWVSE